MHDTWPGNCGLRGMAYLKMLLPVVILLAGFLLYPTATYSKPEYVKQTKKACGYCHVDAQKTPKELNEAGKYFQQHKSLEGYREKK